MRLSVRSVNFVFPSPPHTPPRGCTPEGGGARAAPVLRYRSACRKRVSMPPAQCTARRRVALVRSRFTQSLEMGAVNGVGAGEWSVRCCPPRALHCVVSRKNLKKGGKGEGSHPDPSYSVRCPEGCLKRTDADVLILQKKATSFDRLLLLKRHSKRSRSRNHSRRRPSTHTLRAAPRQEENTAGAGGGAFRSFRAPGAPC